MAVPLSKGGAERSLPISGGKAPCLMAKAWEGRSGSGLPSPAASPQGGKAAVNPPFTDGPLGSSDTDTRLASGRAGNVIPGCSVPQNRAGVCQLC